MPKLFITGATGYIGGDALYAIAAAHPSLSITALVRNSEKGAKVASQYANVRLVYGDLDSTELLIHEAASSDVVLHCAHADHVGAAEALVAGLSKRTTPGYLIHASGTGSLGWEDADASMYGFDRQKVYDDWDGIGEVTSLPDHVIHRNVDKIVLGAGSKSPNVHSAVVAPPCIYGPGRGPDNQRSVQVYDMANAVLKRGKGFKVGEGKNRWTQVHVQDLSNVFSSLVTAALEPNGGKATWDDQGFYFAENGDIIWGEVAEQIAKAAHEKKLIESADLDQLNEEDADKLRFAGAYLWGTNSRCRSYRANKLFGWTSKEKVLSELIPDIVEGEAKALGLIKGHAEVAAGGS